MCGNEIFNSYISPDKKYKVVVFQRDCGATTSFNTQISIIKNGKKLPKESGNTFTGRGHPDNHLVKVTWINNKQLIIHENFSESYLRKSTVKGIKIIFQNSTDLLDQ